MKKECLFLVVVFFWMSFFAQNQPFDQKIDSLKKKDNLAEFIYVHLDKYSHQATQENLIVFEQLSKGIWRQPTTKSEALAYVYFYVNYAYYLKEFGFIDKSIINYEKAYGVFKKHQINQYNIIEYCLKPLANNYTRIGDVERAEDVLKITIEMAQKQQDTFQIKAAYSNLSALLRTKGEFNLAIKYLNIALNYASTKSEKAQIFSDLAINYLMLNDYDAVIHFIQKSSQNNVSNNSALLAKNAITLGTNYYNKNNTKLAIVQLNKALKKSVHLYGKNNREVAKIYNLLAQVYEKEQEFLKAQQNYQLALITLLPTYKPTSIYEHPSKTTFYPENTLKDSFDGRASAFEQSKNYIEALANYDLAFAVDDMLRVIYTNQTAKLIQQQDNRIRSEKCIELCYFLYQQSNDGKWLEKAFLYAEKSKATVLVQTKQLHYKKEFIGNDTLFKIENELEFKKAQLSKSITVEQLKQENASVTILAKLTNERNNVSTALQLINQQIQKKYPHLIHENSDDLSVSKIKNELLKNNEMLIEFFEGKTFVYVFYIKKDEPILVKKISKSATFTNQIHSFLNFFSDERGTLLQNNTKDYTKLAHQLYQKLFLEQTSKNIIIIPDGILSFIPFDALLTNATETVNFEKLPYFIKKSTITYAYSATLSLQKKFETHKKKLFLGFFPVFENNHRGLSQLVYTVQESKDIQQVFKGNFLLHQKASKKNFEEISATASILHLSTHASAGDMYEPPFIEFYDDKLYLPEIYGYNLNTNLLVLSACETGLGTLRKGEGAMSLARGFTYAGVQNLIVSLWKVNDKSTAILMSNFYKKYQKNKNSGVALHQSKLNYLEDKNIASAKKSPYYWASFIYIGATSSTSNLSNYYWLILVVIVGLMVFFIYKKR